MNDTMCVQILEGIDDLHGVTLNFQFMQALPASKKLIQTLILAQLQNYVHILWIFEEVLKFDNMEVRNGPMDLDFTHEFLLGSTLN